MREWSQQILAIFVLFYTLSKTPNFKKVWNLFYHRSANTMFSVEWLGHKVALKASNGKYICTKKNGQLVAVSDSIGRGQSFILQPLSLVIKRWLLPLFLWSLLCWLLPGDDEQFTLKLINRPMLILRGENGFICHHRNSNTLDASRSVYDIFTVQFSNGAYHIKGQHIHQT